MNRKISLLISITVADLRRVLEALPEVKADVVTEGGKKERATPRNAKATREKPSKKGRVSYFRHPSGLTAEDFIKGWLDVNRVGRRRDLVKHLVDKGYSQRTANNMVDAYCRKMEKTGALVRTDGFINMK